MSEYWKAIFKRAGWTMAEAALACIGGATQMEEVDWKMLVSIVVLAGIVSVLKSFVVGVPEAAPAEEIKEEDVKDIEPVPYPDEDNYDDLHVDDEDDDEGDTYGVEEEE